MQKQHIRTLFSTKKNENSKNLWIAAIRCSPYGGTINMVSLNIYRTIMHNIADEITSKVAKIKTSFFK